MPAEIIDRYLSIQKWLSIPVATIMGIPLYANSVSVIPIIKALISKGIPLRTALSFFTATLTLTIPEALILKKAMKWKLLLVFFHHFSRYNNNWIFI